MVCQRLQHSTYRTLSDKYEAGRALSRDLLTLLVSSFSEQLVDMSFLGREQSDALG
jgi:hypothetical protein